MDPATSFNFPFTAIVGQEPMKLALTLAAIQPAIGGVLIQGERGTAKTTTVRGLPGVLKEVGGTGNKGGSDSEGGESAKAASAVHVVELPLNATEDRVVGTLNVGALMKSGEREFVPGVLAEADGNILYVDEINLLEDHLVDLLLDAAATGVCHIEREGVSKTYPARFVLVGTMNPEEGTLRPQLLDRFGLSVQVSGSLSAQDRLELVRRHTAFETDPEAFCAQYAEEEAAYAQQIAQARQSYDLVVFPESMAMFAAKLCDEIGVDGYRADLVLMRASRALAAFEGRNEVSEDDVLRVAQFALPHRMKKLPFEEVGLSEAALERAAEVLHKQMAEQAVAGAVEAEAGDSKKAERQ